MSWWIEGLKYFVDLNKYTILSQFKIKSISVSVTEKFLNTYGISEVRHSDSRICNWEV